MLPSGVFLRLVRVWAHIAVVKGEKKSLCQLTDRTRVLEASIVCGLSDCWTSPCICMSKTNTSSHRLITAFRISRTKLGPACFIYTTFERYLRPSGLGLGRNRVAHTHTQTHTYAMVAYTHIYILGLSIPCSGYHPSEHHLAF